ncbi:MAG: LCP family protein [Micropruina sp.]|nr:LCP family protein [Micropruina sp.]
MTANSPGRRIAGNDVVEPTGQARRAIGTAHGSFSGSLGWTVLGTLIPGLGLWHARRRVLGGLVMGLWLAILAGLGVLASGGTQRLAALAVDPTVLTMFAVALLVGAIGWVVVIAMSPLALRPAQPSLGQRAAGAGLVTLLALAVAAPMAVGAQYAYTTANFLSTVFGESVPLEPGSSESAAPVDPWANKPRINVLIIGGDSGTNRDVSLGLRADAVMWASIDTKTGDTTLFSLPRQTARIPFPADSPLHRYYPYGFTDGNGSNAEYFLNAMYNNVPLRIPQGLLGPRVSNVGAQVMKIGVGEALGLGTADYFVVVNMDGFKEFINALGGVTLNVNYRIPIGGKSSEGVPPDDWIEVGPSQHMDGRKALWYARGRYSLDDYSRMERQRCVINAVVEQANPTTVLTRFEKIASAGKKIILTDVPRKVLPNLLDLAFKVKDTKLHSVVFKPGVAGWVSSNPDWDAVRKRVTQALKETAKSNAKAQEAEETPTPSVSVSGTPSKSPKASASPSTSPSATTKTDDLSDSCAYHPEK